MTCFLESVAAVGCVLLFTYTSAAGELPSGVARSAPSHASPQAAVPTAHPLPAPDGGLAIQDVTLGARAAITDSAATWSLGDSQALVASECRELSVQVSNDAPANLVLEVRLAERGTERGTERKVQLPAESATGAPRLLRARVCPSVPFGPEASGALGFRLLNPKPLAPPIHVEHEPPLQVETDARGETVTRPLVRALPAASEWRPLGVVVRLPALTQLLCPRETARPCTLRGTHLDRIAAVSANAQFSEPYEVPQDGSATRLQVPHATRGTLYIKLRDDADFVSKVVVTPASP